MLKQQKNKINFYLIELLQIQIIQSLNFQLNLLNIVLINISNNQIITKVSQQCTNISSKKYNIFNLKKQYAQNFLKIIIKLLLKNLDFSFYYQNYNQFLSFFKINLRSY